jgi:hypothetical protein
VIDTVEGFAIVNEAHENGFTVFFAFSMIHLMFAIWSLVPLPFLKPACSSAISLSMCVTSLSCIILSSILLAWGISAMVL